MKCAQCGREVCSDDYFTYTDSFLQTKYFDSEEENIFCTEECAQKALGLEWICED